MNVQSTSAMLALPAVGAMRNQTRVPALPGQQRPGLDRGRTKLFRGDNVPAMWKEWQYGGEYAIVKLAA